MAPANLRNYLILHICQKKGAKRDVVQIVMANFRLANVPVNIFKCFICAKKGRSEENNAPKNIKKMGEMVGLVGLRAGCRLGPGGCPGRASEGDPHGAWKLIRTGPERGYPRRGQRVQSARGQGEGYPRRARGLIARGQGSRSLGVRGPSVQHHEGNLRGVMGR